MHGQAGQVAIKGDVLTTTTGLSVQLQTRVPPAKLPVPFFTRYRPMDEYEQSWPILLVF